MGELEGCNLARTELLGADVVLVGLDAIVHRLILCLSRVYTGVVMEKMGMCDGWWWGYTRGKVGLGGSEHGWGRRVGLEQGRGRVKCVAAIIVDSVRRGW